ncbi:Glycosyltransferase [Cupriavidus necator]|uniref:rhamnosyltransferase WsaF family glycosyltransferase n=1 Tax=Cupriavidus necator TaxID=106590 RepID=UPI003F74063B
MSKKTFILRVVRRIVFMGRKFLLLIHHYASLVEHRLSAVIEGRPAAKQGEQIRVKSFDEVYYGANAYVTPVMPALPKAGRSPAVVVLVPTLSDSSLFGGVATALIFAALLSKKTGRDLRIVQTVVNGKASKLQGLFDKYQVSIDASDIEILSVAERRHNYYGYLDLHPEDQLVVSAWWDATIAAALPLRRRFIYLVQDYEPIFYANGDTRLLAEHSYQSQRFVAVCNTHLMLKCIRDAAVLHPLTPVVSFEPAVARLAGTQGNLSGVKTRKTLFFYGRPGVERNLFHFGLRVLNEAFSRGVLDPEVWEIVMAGETQVPNIQLECGAVVRNLGKLSLDEYDEVKRKTDLALSLMMAPHPSYPPLEFALAGAAVVTTAYGPKRDLSAYSPNIVCVEPELESMVGAIGRAAAFPVAEREANAINTILPDNWVTSFQDVFERIVELVETPVNLATVPADVEPALQAVSAS